MNRITHKLALWWLERMMIRANKIDEQIAILGSKIYKYERAAFNKK
jgi:hypothetical protein